MTGTQHNALPSPYSTSRQILDYAPAFLIWLGSLYSMPQFIFMIALGVGICLRWDSFKIQKADLTFITLIITLSLINFTIGNLTIPDGQQARSPYFIAYIGVFLLANLLNKKDLQCIAILIALESLTIFIEAYLGVNTLFTNHPEFRSGLDFSMLYFARPFALTDGINDFGAKLLAAIIITDYLVTKSRLQKVLRTTLLLALIINFSRTTLFAVAIHYMLLITFNTNARVKLKIITALLGSIIVVMFSVGMDNFIDFIANQINRGKTDGVDMSYRDVIWGTSLDFIEKNPLFGNGSSRFHVWLSDYQAWEHAHNSYLHLLSSNGLIIAGLMLYWIGININRKNILPITPILIFCIGQYGIFWGISFLDIIFLTLLLLPKLTGKSNRNQLKPA
jgi:O-antigen ligase